MSSNEDSGNGHVKEGLNAKRMIAQTRSLSHSLRRSNFQPCGSWQQLPFVCICWQEALQLKQNVWSFWHLSCLWWMVHPLCSPAATDFGMHAYWITNIDEIQLLGIKNCSRSTQRFWIAAIQSVPQNDQSLISRHIHRSLFLIMIQRRRCLSLFDCYSSAIQQSPQTFQKLLWRSCECSESSSSSKFPAWNGAIRKQLHMTSSCYQLAPILSTGQPVKVLLSNYFL